MRLARIQKISVILVLLLAALTATLLINAQRRLQQADLHTEVVTDIFDATFALRSQLITFLVAPTADVQNVWAREIATLRHTLARIEGSNDSSQRLTQLGEDLSFVDAVFKQLVSADPTKLTPSEANELRTLRTAVLRAKTESMHDSAQALLAQAVKQAVNTARDLGWLSALLALALVAGFTGYWMLIQRRALAPMARLLAATEQLAAGDLEAHVESKTQDEMGDLTRSFNLMGERLAQAQQTYAEALAQRARLAVRGRLMERIRLQGLLIEAAHGAIIVRESAGRILQWNRGAADLYGYASENAIDRPLDSLLATRAQNVNDSPEQDLLIHGYWQGELVQRCADGREVTVLAEWTLLSMQSLPKEEEEEEEEEEHESGQNLVLEVHHDITERKHAEAAVRASLSEKEVLLQEIHHRVKNNLQLVSALINMQQRRLRRLGEGESRDALRECQNRIRSIALIHEQLYRTTDFTKVPFADYTRSLATNIFHATGLSESRITLKVDIDDIALAVDQAVPCGLIMNELITNALKHGIKAEEQGTIQVALKTATEGRVVLSVSDSGCGLPVGFDPRATKSLGFQIIRTLSEQLRASLEISPQAVGACISITFKLGN